MEVNVMISGISSMSNSYAMMSANAMQRSDPFKKVDGDGDGVVSQGELETFAADINEKTGVSLDVEEALAAYDADGDGGLNNEEMKSLVEESGFAPPPPPPPPGNMEIGLMTSDEASSTDEKLVQAMQRSDPFQALDSDGDGVASQSELETLAALVEERTGQVLDVEEALSTYDADGDGGLNEEEMKTFVKESGFGPPPPPPGGPAGLTEDDEEDSIYQALVKEAISAYFQNSGESELNDLFSLTSGESSVGTDYSVSVTT